MTTTSPIQLSDGLAALAERVRPSVVQVRAGSRGIGSGIVWQASTPTGGAPEATILTNAHVVRATGDGSLTIRFADKRELNATLLGIDMEHDLAALRIQGDGFAPAEIRDSSTLRVGELVLAVGNPFGREGAVTVGVVAARAPADPDAELEPAEPGDGEPAPPKGAEAENGRRNPHSGRPRWSPQTFELIQADIRLYPGNSGGPLLDASGRVVGVNAMISGGLAFAIPSRIAQDFLGELDTATQRPRLGVEVLTVPVPVSQRQDADQESAVLVTGIAPESAAERAGMLVGDVILAVNERGVATAEGLLRALRSTVGAADGGAITLTLLRGGVRTELALVPELRAVA